MTPHEALLFAARVLHQTGEAGTDQAVLLLEQLAEDYPVATRELPQDKRARD
jgi:hypothetical protein